MTGGINFLVTAKHVVFNKDGKLLPQFYVRRNKEGGGFINHWFLCDALEPRVFVHPDKSVDIAVLPISGDPEKMFTSLPLNLVATRESMKNFKIREGDEMFFLGLFTPFYGSKSNFPVYRFGRLSMIPTERIPFEKDAPEQDLLLMETQVFGGNSGAPCFYYFNERRNPNDTSILLAGVVKGYYRDWSQVQHVNATTNSFSERNMGISALTPAYYIRDIVEGEEVKKFIASLQLPAMVVTNTPSSTALKK
jgi:hypothetical protein